jgi:hypothetical protein
VRHGPLRGVVVTGFRRPGPVWQFSFETPVIS